MRPQIRTLLLLFVAAAVLVPAAADARPRGPKAKAAAALDRELVGVMHLRDRGDLAEAMEVVQRLIAEHPESVAAHRLYQEMAVLGRRNARLVEAEYRHALEAAPDDPLRKLLHASATLTAAVITPEMHADPVIRDIERSLAAAEADKGLEDDAHMVAADLNHFIGETDAVERHLRAGYAADKANYIVRADLVAWLSQAKRWDEATELCLELIDDAPWRLISCVLLLPRKAGEPAASAEDQARVTARLEAVEDEAKDDPITLQSLEWLYDYLGEKKGSARLRERLAELDPTWKPPLERNPYLQALPGGELTEEEVAVIEQVRAVKEAAGDDAEARVQGLRDVEGQLPDSARIAAYYWREVAFALRVDEVLDRDGSRAAIRKALDATPDDPSIMNEWAYMSAVDKVDLPEALETIEAALSEVLGEEFEPIAIEPGSTFSDYEIDRGESVGAFIDTRGWVLYQLGRHAEAVQDLYLASLLTADGTVHGHLGRARYAVGNDRGAFEHLLRALALGTEDEDEVRDLALHLYEKLHVVPGGLDALVDEMRRQLRREVQKAQDSFDLGQGPRGGSDRGTVRSRAVHPLVGQSAPQFGLTTLGGDRVELESLRGKVVVVDFWATWCAPCVEAMPVMDSLSRALADEDVVFVALSMDESVREVERFWGSSDSPIRVGMAEPGVADAFGVDGIPATFVLDQRGQVADYQAGYDAEMAEALMMVVVRLLADPHMGR